MTEFDLWVKSCEEFNLQIYPLEGEGENALYQTWEIGEPHIGTKWNYYRKGLTYQVFIDGKRCFVSTNYRLAYSFWENHHGQEHSIKTIG